MVRLRSLLCGRRGVTLLEVLIAIAILAAGVLVAVAFQVSSLRTNTRAQVMNQLTRLATAEMELRRQTSAIRGTSDCETSLPNLLGLTCEVTTLRCSYVVQAGGTTFTCDDEDTEVFATYLLTVEASARGEAVRLESLFGGFYVSGNLAEGGSE